MKYILYWTPEAWRDVERLCMFLDEKSKNAARELREELCLEPEILGTHPRIGQRMEKFQDREIRRWIIGDYELRYEIIEQKVVILRIWHGREDR